ncbi:MAG: hypothetical protein AAFY60_11540, partial [Myxococcota bacterium]
TLGWIRLQRERKEPREGWAEKAADSFKVAEELADRDTEQRLYAAARLNSGNALFALNKLDDAFLAYLDRERQRLAFDAPITELIFRERFARTALREDHLDVALDQARLAHGLSLEMDGQPRSASLAALIGAIYIQAQVDRRAIPWLTDAQEVFEKRQDWDRAVPLLRTLSLAELRLGRLVRAREHIDHIRELIRSDRGPADPARPFFENFEFLIWSEVPALLDDVTLGPYGFNSTLELQIADALAARTRIAEGQLEEAMGLMESRLALLREVYERGIVGVYARPEWIVALNEAALVASRIGNHSEASGYFVEAMTAARSARRWRAVIQLAESWLHLWIDAPEIGETQTLDTVGSALEEARLSADPDDSSRSARIDALVNTLRFHRSKRALNAPASNPDPEILFRERLARLNETAESANRAERLVAEYRLEELEGSLPPPTYERVLEQDAPPENAELLVPDSSAIDAGAAVTDSDEPAPKPDEALGEAEASDETGQASGEDELNEDVDNETHTDAAGEGLEEAPEPDEEEQRGALFPVSFSRRTIQWRIDYDRSLRSNDSLSEANEG